MFRRVESTFPIPTEFFVRPRGTSQEHRGQRQTAWQALIDLRRSLGLGSHLLNDEIFQTHLTNFLELHKPLLLKAIQKHLPYFEQGSSTQEDFYQELVLRIIQIVTAVPDLPEHFVDYSTRLANDMVLTIYKIQAGNGINPVSRDNLLATNSFLRRAEELLKITGSAHSFELAIFEQAVKKFYEYTLSVDDLRLAAAQIHAIISFEQGFLSWSRVLGSLSEEIPELKAKFSYRSPIPRRMQIYIQSLELKIQRVLHLQHPLSWETGRDQKNDTQTEDSRPTEDEVVNNLQHQRFLSFYQEEIDRNRYLRKHPEERAQAEEAITDLLVGSGQEVKAIEPVKKELRSIYYKSRFPWHKEEK